MDLVQFFTIIATNMALFIWARTEANQDRRDMNSRLDASLKAISEEMRDFHGRLISIEEKRMRKEK